MCVYSKGGTVENLPSVTTTRSQQTGFSTLFRYVENRANYWLENEQQSEKRPSRRNKKRRKKSEVRTSQLYVVIYLFIFIRR